MMRREESQRRTIDIKDLSFERGAHLLIKRELNALPVGSSLAIRGSDPTLSVHLRAWCRAQGHDLSLNGDSGAAGVVAWITRGSASSGRWRDAQSTGRPDPKADAAVLNRPQPTWGLAARGARVESGGPEFSFALSDKEEVWADNVPKLYAQAAAAQWDPASAIDWDAEFELPVEVEQAVVQVMTYLIENENAALLVPARFLSQIHPHFREVMQLLAIQIADEARHVEVFTRRATLRGTELGLSTVSGQQSLKTLLDEPDFSLASFLLSVLGEGTFLNLLWFLEKHAPDPVTRQVARLTARDEGRHVAFGLSHLQYQLALDPLLRSRLSLAMNRRHDTLASTAGLNEEVFDALVILAAGEWTPEAIAEGYAKVQELQEEMHSDRTARLVKLGFPA
ncbi:MAG TPA: hypothetical protein VKB46_20755, partial [Pyrinomonadaceae bacterium]|nr:hypothetical protein [Pyrinomonadaceae bacterium]